MTQMIKKNIIYIQQVNVSVVNYINLSVSRIATIRVFFIFK